MDDRRMVGIWANDNNEAAIIMFKSSTNNMNLRVRKWFTNQPIDCVVWRLKGRSHALNSFYMVMATTKIEVKTL